MKNRFQSIKLIDQGVVFMILSALLSALNGAVAKLLCDTMDPIEIVFYRNLLGIIIILYSLKNSSIILNNSKLHLLFLRGLFGALAMILFFYTIATIPLSTSN